MTATPPPRRVRSLGLTEGIAIQVGMIIGSGIFLVSATIAGHLGSLGPILLVWLLGGLLVLFGALTLAELSSVLPETGGPYVYLEHSFGACGHFRDRLAVLVERNQMIRGDLPAGMRARPCFLRMARVIYTAQGVSAGARWLCSR